MADQLYHRLQKTASALITKFGQQGTVTRLAPPDPIEGGDPVPTPYTAKLVPMRYEQKYIDGTNITTADREVYISSVGLPIEPAVGDLVTDAKGVSYHIVAGDPNNYDGITNVVFIVQGRIA